MKESKVVQSSLDSENDVGIGEVSMAQNGNALEERFNLWSTLGMQYSLQSTSIAIGTYLSIVVGVGGSPVFFFGYILGVGMNFCIALSLAEIAAVFPNASGQIYWTAILVSQKRARSASYVAGWLACAAWFFWTAGQCLITSQLIWALVQVCHSTFILQPWHYYLGYLACAIISLLMNIPLFKFYPYFTRSLLFIINGGAIFIFVTLLVRSHPKQPASYVFTDFVNYTGWNSKGVVFFLGLLPGVTAVNGFDGVAHMTDELPHPERRVPQVMIGSSTMSAISGVPMILAYMFCVVNPTNLLTPIGGQPVAQLILDSVDSLALTIIALVIFIVAMMAACITIMTAFTRVWWAFAREGGVPFSPFFAKIDSHYHLPINSIIFCCVAVVAIGLIELGSSTALNAILGCGVICIYLSFSIPIVALLLEKRASFPAVRYFNLGKAGIVLNCIAVGWISMMTVWLCFPLYLPVTGTGMNYAVPVMVGVVLVTALNWWLYSRKIFTVPAAKNYI